jgi:hypothetical protein
VHSAASADENDINEETKTGDAKQKQEITKKEKKNQSKRTNDESSSAKRCLDTGDSRQHTASWRVSAQRETTVRRRSVQREAGGVTTKQE